MAVNAKYAEDRGWAARRQDPRVLRGDRRAGARGRADLRVRTSARATSTCRPRPSRRTCSRSSTRTRRSTSPRTDGADVEALGKQLDELVADLPTVVVQDLEEFTEAQTGPINTFLAIVYGLLGLAIIIALIGITNTLSLSVLERTRELGLLRAVGMSRRQLKRMVRTEAAIIAVFGTLIGLVIGIIFSIALTIAISADTPDLFTYKLPVAQLGDDHDRRRARRRRRRVAAGAAGSQARRARRDLVGLMALDPANLPTRTLEFLGRVPPGVAHDAARRRVPARGAGRVLLRPRRAAGAHHHLRGLPEGRQRPTGWARRGQPGRRWPLADPRGHDLGDHRARTGSLRRSRATRRGTASRVSARTGWRWRSRSTGSSGAADARSGVVRRARSATVVARPTAVVSAARAMITSTQPMTSSPVNSTPRPQATVAPPPTPSGPAAAWWAAYQASSLRRVAGSRMPATRVRRQPALRAEPGEPHGDARRRAPAPDRRAGRPPQSWVMSEAVQ